MSGAGTSAPVMKTSRKDERLYGAKSGRAIKASPIDGISTIVVTRWRSMADRKDRGSNFSRRITVH